MEKSRKARQNFGEINRCTVINQWTALPEIEWSCWSSEKGDVPRGREKKKTRTHPTLGAGRVSFFSKRRPPNSGEMTGGKGGGMQRVRTKKESVLRILYHKRMLSFAPISTVQHDFSFILSFFLLLALSPVPFFLLSS